MLLSDTQVEDSRMSHGNCVTALEQRVSIWELAQKGQTDPAIAQQLGLSPSVVRKWRRRAP